MRNVLTCLHTFTFNSFLWWVKCDAEAAELSLQGLNVAYLHAAG